MNQEHHRQFALDALRSTALLTGSDLIQNLDAKLLAALRNKEARNEFVDMAAAPDRIRDTCLTLPALPEAINPFPDTYSILDHNLSSFQHFECSRDGKSEGYLWHKDASLTLPGEWASSEILEHLHTHVVYAQDPRGEKAPFVDGPPTPMKVAHTSQLDKTLDGFEFPSASRVGGFYGDHASALWQDSDFAGWRACAGFALHFVHDALVPHHVWGCLLYGHSEWENQIEAFWKNHLRLLHSTDPTGQLYKETTCKVVAEELGDILKHEMDKSVAGLICVNAAYTAEWLAYRGMHGPADLPVCESNDALRICIRAVASSIRALMLMVV